MKKTYSAILGGAGALFLAASVMNIASPVHADDSMADVAAEIGWGASPVDYVLLVDTSGSMQSQWAEAVSAISEFPASMGQNDSLFLITFDTDPEVVWQGPTPADGTVLTAALPASPNGGYTDIGRGLEAAVGQLEREGAAPAAVVVLLTDGILTTADGSDYGTVDVPAWETLRARAAALPGTVGAFALSLGAETDAGVMRNVFPDADVADQTALRDYLGLLNQRALEGHVTQVLEADVAQPVSVSWADVDDGAEVTISSPYAHLPVELTELAIVGSGGATAEWESPASLVLEPGESQTFAVDVEPGATAGALALTATVGSRWASVLDQTGLVLPALAEVSHPVAAAVPSAPSPSPAPTPTPTPTPQEAVVEEPQGEAGLTLPEWWPWGLAGLGALLLVGLVVLVADRSKPLLGGTVCVTGEGIEREFLLTGREFSIPANAAGLKGTITSPDAKSESVRFAGRLDGQKHVAVMNDGEFVELGPLTLTWTAQRSRVLRKIQDLG